MAATCGLDFERTISGSSLDTRRVIDEAVRELGFEITADQLTRIEAKRGGMLGYSLLMKKQMPVLAVFDLSAAGSGCLLTVHLTDNIKAIGKSWGVNRQYRAIFDEVQQRVDLALARLDGVAAAAFGEPRFWSRSADIGVLEESTRITSKAVGGAVGAAGKVFHRSSGTTPRAWKGVDSVTFTSSAGVAVLTLAETQADLGVAVMVVSHPGAMPAALAHDVETFAGSVEQKLTAAGGGAAEVDVSDAYKPVFEFLRQQSQIRACLPMRELHICRSCRLEKIKNPEYQRIVLRNEKIGHLAAGVGATIGKGGITPTFVLGQVFKLKRLDPEFVCSRCQGMEDDERLVTFCPSCANLQRDVVLRLCPKCGFDYRTKAGTAPIWSVPAAPEPEPELAAAEPAWAEPDSERPHRPAAELAPKPAERTAAPEVLPVSAPLPGAVPEAPAVRGAATASPAEAKQIPVPAAQPPTTPPTAVAWPRPNQVPLGRPEKGRRGKVCHMCRREFPSLWRVVISTPDGFEERFICGTNSTCQMPSLVTAVQV